MKKPNTAKWIVGLFFCLLIQTTEAQQWERQYPFYDINQMNDIEVTAEGWGAAIGGNRLTLLTSNFGETWEESAALPGLTLYEVKVIVINNQPIIWGTTSNSFFKSEDWGANWEQVVTGFSTGITSHLYLTDENTIIAGGQSTFVKSTDAGQTWTDITPLAGQNWNTMFFLDSNKGWAGTNMGDIYSTTNGGTSWTLINDSQFEDPMTIVFYTASNGYLAVNREFWKTTDAGQSWTLLNEVAFGAYPRELEVIDANHIVGARGFAGYASNDGGLTWERTTPVTYAYSNEGVCALPDGQVWIAGSYRAIAHSEDNGFNFDDQIPGNRNSLNKIEFWDDQNGWAFGNNKSILRTTNGGNEWAEASVPPYASFNSIFDAVVFSPEELWVCSARAIFRTQNAGVTWDSIFQGNGIFYSLERAGDYVFGTTSGGEIYRADIIGNNWELLESGTTEWLYDIYFPSPQIGYAVGWNGTILKTTNGGNSWTALDASTAVNLEFVYFKDDQTGWVIQSSGSNEMFFTEDGGQSWSVQTLPVSSFWKRMKFVDAQIGYIVGGSAGSGRVAQTLDGGATWEVIHSNSSLTFDIATAYSAAAQKMWVCGQGGNIEYIDFFSTGIRETSKVKSIEVFPNPSDGFFYLDLPEQLSPATRLHVYDALGRHLLNYPLSNNMDLSALSAGSYTIIIQDQQLIYQARIIKQ